jgi:hypothetical protein
MSQALVFLLNADAVAFVLLGVATAVSWARRRDRSLGFLALRWRPSCSAARSSGSVLAVLGKRSVKT